MFRIFHKFLPLIICCSCKDVPDRELDVEDLLILVWVPETSVFCHVQELLSHLNKKKIDGTAPVGELMCIIKFFNLLVQIL